MKKATENAVRRPDGAAGRVSRETRAEGRPAAEAAGGAAQALPGKSARLLMRAIRAKCLDCCGGIRAEVRGCRIEQCPLWPYRCADAGAIELARQAAGPGRPASDPMPGQMELTDLYGEAVL